MAIGGAFLGGGVEVVPAGSCKLELEILTEDRANLTATFTIKGTSTYTVTAGADGRAVYTVPSGQTYTVSVNTTGYDNIASQTVVAESGTVRYVRFEAFAGRVKRSGDTMTGELLANGGVRSNFIRKLQSDGQNVAFVLFEETETSNIASLNARKSTGTNTAVYPALKLFANKDGTYYATLTSKYDGTTDNSEKIATCNWVNQASFLVHSYGNEEIAGTKTFLANILINKKQDSQLTMYATDLTRGVAPGSNTSPGRVRFTDYNNATFGEVYSTVGSDGSTTITLTAVKNQPSRADCNLVVGWDAGGKQFATAPSTQSDATSNQIATADWSIGKFVQKSGDTMTGLLNLDSLQFTSTYGSWRFRPSGTGFPVLSIYANNDSSKPFIQMSLSSNELRLGGDNNRVISNYPIANDDNTKVVATTAWVNNADCIVHRYNAESILGLKTFKDPIHLVNDLVSYTQSQDASTWTYLRGIEFRDKNSERMGEIRSVRYTNTVGVLVNSTEIIARGKDNIDTLLAIVTADNGQKYAYCPSTPSNATNNMIATADWVIGKVAQRNKVTNVTSYAQLIELIKSGKQGDSFGITMDYVGTSLGGITNSANVEVHAFGHYTIDEIKVSDGTLTGLQAFGSGEVSGKLKVDDDSTYTYATTGFGRQKLGNATFDAFRVVEDGNLTYFLPDSSKVTSIEGYYISI